MCGGSLTPFFFHPLLSAIGYTGQFCEEIIDNCVDNACLNGASCVNGINSYTCSCTSGWTGNLCQTSVDDCSNSPCLNGATCIDG